MGGFCFVNVWTLATINVQQIDLFSCQVYVLKGLFQPGRSYDSTPGLQFLTAESWCQTQTSPLLWLQESQFFVGQGTFSSSSGSFGCALCVCAPQPCFRKRHSEVDFTENKELGSAVTSRACGWLLERGSVASLETSVLGAAGWQLLGFFLVLVVPVLWGIKATLSGTALTVFLFFCNT